MHAADPRTAPHPSGSAARAETAGASGRTTAGLSGIGWLQGAIHALFALLVVIAVLRASYVPDAHFGWALTLGILTLAIYAAGLPIRRAPARIRTMLARVWLGALAVSSLALTCVIADAAYLVFPLLFLCLHVVGPREGVIVTIALTVITIVVVGLRYGLTPGGVLGPAVAAVVAIGISIAYRALDREIRERKRLYAELLDAQAQLADTQREAGRMAERERLAREIHDTVAQSLSSIQLLLHAAERDTARASEHIALARSSAADALAETRSIISELTPAPLESSEIGQALARLATETAARTGLDIEVDDRLTAAVDAATSAALYRAAQATLANVEQHAKADTVRVTLENDAETVTMDIVDDGVGFDPESIRPGSFGIRGLRSRMAEIGGFAAVESTPGEGTAVTVQVPRKRGATA